MINLKEIQNLTDTTAPRSISLEIRAMSLELAEMLQKSTKLKHDAWTFIRDSRITSKRGLTVDLQPMTSDMSAMLKRLAEINNRLDEFVNRKLVLLDLTQFDIGEHLETCAKYIDLIYTDLDSMCKDLESFIKDMYDEILNKKD